MTIAQLHNKALELAEIAFHEKMQRPKKALKLFKEAYEFEKQASELARQNSADQLTLSVLLKSTASLAINAELPREAEKAIGLALSGEPPFEIAEELRNLLEEVNFSRHLQLKGIELESGDLQFVISGKSVSYGMVKSDEFFDRLEIFEKLTLRTIERKLNKPFRDKGNFSNEVRNLYTPYYSIPRAASFALTVRIGRPKKQLEFTGFEKSKDIVDDLMENIDLVNKGRIDELRKNIDSEAYFTNFLSLTKELAPDGEEVSLIGFTVKRGGKERRVQFTRKKSEFDIASFIKPKNSGKVTNKKKQIKIKGLLSAADLDLHKLRLKVKPGKSIHVKVPAGMGDIVRKYFESEVLISAIQINNNTVQLLSIDAAE